MQTKRQMVVAWLVFVIIGSGLAGGETVPLWPDGAPGATGSGKEDVPTMTTFPLPDGTAEPVPAVLLIPGGGYKHISGHGTYRSFFAKHPVRFFTMKYRLPVHGYRHPAPLQDAQRAVRMIRAQAKAWQIDPGRVMVVAFSSGGHVASTLGTHFEAGDPAADDPLRRFSSRPDAMALLCPVISMTDHAHRPSVVRLLGPEPDEALLEELSNELQVDATAPPTFLAHAKDDKLVPPENSKLFHEALKKAGVQTVLHLYEQGGHGVTKEGNPWQKDLTAWMLECGILEK